MKYFSSASERCFRATYDEMVEGRAAPGGQPGVHGRVTVGEKRGGKNRMEVLNFSHPLSPDAMSELTRQFGELNVRQIRVQLDMTQPIAAQVAEIAGSVGFTPAEWQTTAFVVVLPGASIATGLLLAEIHGRSGGFPRVVSLVSGEDRVFRVQEIIDLQGVRNDARTRR